MKAYTKGEIAALKPYSSKNANTRFKLKTSMGFIPMDNLEGMGASAITTQVFFKGFSAEIATDIFFKLVGDSDESVDHILKHFKLGGSVANPCIYLNIQGFGQQGGFPFVADFENRDIALALRSVECDRIPVQFVLIGGDIHQQRTPAFMEWVNHYIMSVNNTPVLNTFKRLIFR